MNAPDSLLHGEAPETDPVPTTIQGLIETGIMRVPVSPHLFDLAEEIAAWHARFLGESEEFKAPWTNLEPQGEARDPETGHLPRNGEREHDGLGTYDQKYNFHHRRSLWRILEEKGVELGPYHEWLSLMDELLSASVVIAEQVANELDQVMPGCDFRRQVLASWDERLFARQRHNVRMIQYMPGSHRMLGKGHFDRDFVTPHIAESHPGLQGKFGKRWRPLSVQRGNVLVFFGEKAPLLSGGLLKPLEHRIENVKPGEKRWSAIGFVHTPTLIPHREEALRKKTAT